MSYLGTGPDEPAQLGHTYAGVLVRLGAGDDDSALLDALAEQRFSGWVGPVQAPDGDAWVVAVADQPAGPVAGDRAGVATVVGQLAGRLGVLVLGAAVLRDQVLRLYWAGPHGSGRYDSDPSFGLPEDDETLPDPVGLDELPALATACGRPEAAEPLVDLLGDEIDRESTYESERLRTALRLLGAPVWLVAADSLPRDVPGGPRRGEVRRLGAGAQGAAGVAKGLVVGVVRKRRRPRDT